MYCDYLECKYPYYKKYEVHKVSKCWRLGFSHNLSVLIEYTL